MVNSYGYSFDLLCVPLLHELVGFARRLRNDAASAEDLAQDVMVKAWRGWRTWVPEGLADPERVARAWLYRIMTNLHMNRRRDTRSQERKHEERRARVIDELYANTCTIGADVAYEPAECAPPVSRDIQLALSRLPGKRRRIVESFYLHERSCEQIAEELVMHAPTVRTQLRRARARLRPLVATYARGRYGLRALVPPHQDSPRRRAQGASTIKASMVFETSASIS